jgi:NitT/TauT family transport system substrate-binding protein
MFRLKHRPMRTRFALGFRRRGMQVADRELDARPRLGRLGRAAIGLLFAIAGLGLSGAAADEPIRIATLKTGTLAWQLDTVRAHGLDRKANLAIETIEFASTEGGKIALKGGSADLIVSDWLWVTRERALGDDLVFYPYSSELGAVMVPASSPIKGIADLRGRKLGVAGGPLDKSWLLLQAQARRSGIDLKTEATIAYGAPPLLTQKALQGELDATLTFWNFSAELEATGMRAAISMQDVVRELGAKGPVAMVGYVFNGDWARRNGPLLDRFFSVTRMTEEILRNSPEEWQRLSARIGATSPRALDVYRQRFLEGIPHRSLSDEQADAQVLFHAVAEAGGAEVVGPSRELEPGTFYQARRSE